MSKTSAALAATALAAALLPLAAQAAPAGAMHGKMMHGKMSKMVTLYQADKCHMYFTPAQAKKYAYACPDSKGKMKLVHVTPAVAKMQTAKTNAILTPKKAM